MNREKAYALYRGEKFLGIGTKKELAELLGVKVETISFYGTPAYKKKDKRSKKSAFGPYRLERGNMNLLDIIFLGFIGGWLGGFAWALVVALKGRKEK